MKKMLVVLVLMVAVLLAATGTASAATLTSDYAYSSANGGVHVQGYARARCPEEYLTEGFISSTAKNSSGYNTKVYYIHAGGTMYSRFVYTLAWKSYSKGLSASNNNDDYVSDVDTIQVGTLVDGSECYVKGTHDFKKYSSSTSYKCYTETAKAYHN